MNNFMKYTTVIATVACVIMLVTCYINGDIEGITAFGFLLLFNQNNLRD